MGKLNRHKERHAGEGSPAQLPLVTTESLATAKSSHYERDLGLEMTEGYFPWWHPANYYLVAAMLLVVLAFCAALATAQVNVRATSTLRLSVYVLPVIDVGGLGQKVLARSTQGKVPAVIALPSADAEPVENVRPLSASPWAGIIQLPDNTPHVLARAVNWKENTSGLNSTQAPNGPISSTPPRREIMLHTFTYTPK